MCYKNKYKNPIIFSDGVRLLGVNRFVRDQNAFKI